MLSTSALVASSRVFASRRARFVCLFVWLVVASSRCFSSLYPLALPCHVAMRLVSSRLVSSRLTITSCLDIASRLVVTSRLIVASHRVASHRIASRRVAPTLFCWLSYLCIVSRRCIPSSRPLVRVIVASSLVVATRRIPSHCFIAEFCLFGCRVTYPSASISTLIARRRR